MVLAQRVEGDVARDDELVVALVVRERRGRELLRGEELGERAGDAAGRVAQRLGVGVGPEGDEQLVGGALGRRDVDGGRLDGLAGQGQVGMRFHGGHTRQLALKCYAPSASSSARRVAASSRQAGQPSRWARRPGTRASASSPVWTASTYTSRWSKHASHE